MEGVNPCIIEGIPTDSHPWESIYSGVKENAAILEKQVMREFAEAMESGTIYRRIKEEQNGE